MIEIGREKEIERERVQRVCVCVSVCVREIVCKERGTFQRFLRHVVEVLEAEGPRFALLQQQQSQ